MGTVRGHCEHWEEALGEGTGSTGRGKWEHWEGLGALGASLPPFHPTDILLNVFLAIAVDNLADGDNINSGAEGKK